MDMQQCCFYVVDPTVCPMGKYDHVENVLAALKGDMPENPHACLSDGGSTRSSSTTDPDMSLAQITVHTVIFRVLQKIALNTEPVIEYESRPLVTLTGELLATGGFENSVTGMFRSGTGELLATGGMPSQGFSPHSAPGFYPHSPVALNAYQSDVSGNPLLSSLTDSPPGGDG